MDKTQGIKAPVGRGEFTFKLSQQSFLGAQVAHGQSEMHCLHGGDIQRLM